MFVSRTGLALMLADFRFKVIVIGFFGQAGKNLHPDRLLHKEPVGVIGCRRLLYFTTAQQIREPQLQGFEMVSEPCTNHDPVQINTLAMFAVTLAGTHGTEETVFGENPHRAFLYLRLAWSLSQKLAAPLRRVS